MAERVLQTLLVNSLVFAALFAAVALVRALLGRRLPAGLSLALWAVLAVKLLLPFGFESALSPLAWLHPPAVAAMASPAATTAAVGSQTTVTQPADGLTVVPINAPAQPQVADTGEGSDSWLWGGQTPQGGPSGVDALPGAGEVAPNPADLGTSAVRGPAPWTLWVLLAWASGAVGVALWLALGHLALRRHLREGLAPPPQAVQVLRACRRELGIRRPVELRLLRGGGSPAIAGLLRPVVLVDECLAEDAAALRPVLLHELNHCRSGDLWAIFGLNLLTVVYWFHPLVWALAALARRDMETRCDQRVLARLTRQDQQYYVNTLLHFAGFGAARQPRVVLGMGVSRKTMERRIRDMFRSRRADGFTRWVTAGCAVLMLCVGLLSACMPPTGTPQLAASAAATASPTAVPDTAATMATAAPLASASPAVVPTVTPTAAPTASATPLPHRTQSYPGAEDSVTITVDADILQPAAPLPIVRLAPQGIPMEQVRKMAQTLLEGQTAYEPQVGFTKVQLQAKIKESQDFIGDWDKLVAYYGGGKDGETAARSTQKDFTQRIKGYQKLLATAPETITRKPTDWTFHSSDYYEDTVLFPSDAISRKTQEIQLVADLEAGNLGLIHAANLSSSTVERHTIGFDLGSARNGAGGPQWNPADTRPMTLSADQAVAMVQGKLEAMGILGYTLSALQTTDKEGKPPAAADGGDTQTVYGYSMTFMPTYGGIPLAQCLTYGMSRDKAAIGPDYGYERLTARVMNDRIVSLYWNCPTQMVQTEDADAPLLPLDDVLAAFQAHMQRTITREWLTHDSPQNATHKALMATVVGGGIKITRIQLVLYRMRDKDHKLTFRTIPVWLFYGLQRIQYTNGKGDEYPPEAYTNIIATINAVDGSLFNERLGY